MPRGTADCERGHCGAPARDWDGAVMAAVLTLAAWTMSLLAIALSEGVMS